MGLTSSHRSFSWKFLIESHCHRSLCHPISYHLNSSHLTSCQLFSPHLHSSSHVFSPLLSLLTTAGETALSLESRNGKMEMMRLLRQPNDGRACCSMSARWLRAPSPMSVRLFWPHLSIGLLLPAWAGFRFHFARHVISRSACN